MEICPEYTQRLTKEESSFSWGWVERKHRQQRQKVLDIFEVHKYFQVAEPEWLRRQEGGERRQVEEGRHKGLWMAQ